MTGNPGQGRPPQDRGVSGAEFAGLGLEFAAVILVFTAAGYWIDKRFGTSPWFLIVFVFLGAGGGMASMIRQATSRSRGARGSNTGRGERKP